MIFWEFLKGMNKKDSSSEEIYSYIGWPVENYSIKSHSDNISNKINCSPIFYTSNLQEFYSYDSSISTPSKENDYTRSSWGKIQTSLNFLFLQKIDSTQNDGLCTTWKIVGQDENSFKIKDWRDYSVFKIYRNNNSSNNWFTNINTNIYIPTGKNVSISNAGEIVSQDAIIATKNIQTINGNIIVGKNESTESTGSTESTEGTGNLHVYNGYIWCHQCYIQAPSFNATSDKRAKTAITPIPWGSALQYICNNIHIYNFKYKETDKPSIGVLAQELEDNPIGDFNFIDNIEATGENGDYMMVKESKLIYLALQAIKELKAENYELKTRIEHLESPFPTLRF